MPKLIEKLLMSCVEITGGREVPVPGLRNSAE
jgi:hypothetical protein